MAALNYGYAIIRAIISRTLCLYGFEPALGIHHCNELNNFNLSDDMIEPFRPFIDLVVAKKLLDSDELIQNAKQHYFNRLTRQSRSMIKNIALLMLSKK
jgi:CRISPR-associated protein Cas1